jgi:hypothetical protein
MSQPKYGFSQISVGVSDMEHAWTFWRDRLLETIFGPTPLPDPSQSPHRIDIGVRVPREDDDAADNAAVRFRPTWLAVAGFSTTQLR